MRLKNGLIGRALKGEAAPGKYRDGRNGLLLIVRASGSTSWAVRYMHQGRRHDLGLGPLQHVGLSQARARAAEIMGELKGKGIDPLAERTSQRQQQRGANVEFATAAAAYIEAQKAGWKDPRAAATWTSSLRDHAGPLASRRVGEITPADVYGVLSPIWATLNPTAVRVRGRIESVLSWAKVQGYRHGQNPAAWKDNLAAMLPKPKAVKRKVKHHEAVPFALLPAVYAKLAASDDPIAALIRFTILTAARPGEAMGARLGEIDFTAKTWTLAPERTKKDKMHVVPLSPAAIELLRGLPHPADGDRLFGKIYGSEYLPILREAAGLDDVTLHGCRSSFDDWATSNGHPDRLINYALAHYPSDLTTKAYRREGLIEQRRSMMMAWAEHLDMPKQGKLPRRAA